MLIPNRTSYTLSQALDYLKKHHNYDLLEIADLIHFARNGLLKTVIRMECSNQAIYSIGGIECNIKIISFWESHTVLYKNNHLEVIKYTDALISDRYQFNSRYLYLSGSLDTVDRFGDRKTIDFIHHQNDFIELELRHLYMLSIQGYFDLPKEAFYGNEHSITSQKRIKVPKSFPIQSVKRDENDILVTMSFEINFNLVDVALRNDDTFELSLDQIEILHDDLIRFIQLNENNDVHKIKEYQDKIEQLEKQVAQLHQQLESQNQVILLNEFMENDRLALAIQTRKTYWQAYDEALNNAPKSTAIVADLQQKYNLSQKQAQAIEIIACPLNRN
ncbi:hypothetical protein [Frederiksenia canicola]|uniref:Uncharacterized protein n=1 Tax=Frederiksenia canicola TaxID=123824 RepID=A0AAE6X3T2_9PAST|nr:hypothetical protein [Frederiksenia canicola]QIM64300.1 hypothetical protein A4G17_01935 [Frederiksenia canicola]RPE93845.1 hypothetical protein EDC49_1360 [Frederiksenia canicola]